MKALYIVGIVLSFIFLFVIAFFVAEVQAARFLSYYDYSDPYGYNSFVNYGKDETMMGAIVSFFFFAFFIFAGVLGLIKTKTKTNKVLSIIGLSLSGIYFFWNILVMIDPGSLSYDEVGGGYVFYSLVMLAFMIVGLVQVVKYAKQSNTNMNPSTSTQDILDS